MLMEAVLQSIVEFFIAEDRVSARLARIWRYTAYSLRVRTIVIGDNNKIVRPRHGGHINKSAQSHEITTYS